MFNLLKQKEAFLYNGKKVKEGDKVFFINSDGERLEGVIERRNRDYVLAKPAGHEPRFQQPHEHKVLKVGTLFFLQSVIFDRGLFHRRCGRLIAANDFAALRSAGLKCTELSNSTNFIKWKEH